MRAALTHSGDRQRVWQEPSRASAEASSIEDATIETKETAKAALKLKHPAVLLVQYLFIYLSFSKSEGRDQMSAVGKLPFISQTQSRWKPLRKNTYSWAGPHPL